MPDRFAIGVLVAVLFITGCGGAPDSGSNDTTPASAEATPPEQPPEPDVSETDPPEQPRETLPPEPEPLEPLAATASDEISLVDLAWEGVQEQIAAHKGKVVVVDLWATWCVPCRESFPGLVALSQQDPENVVCMSVSLNDPDDTETRTEALAFLQEQNATFTNLLCTTDSDTLYDEILKIGGIPAVYVYDRDGQFAKLFTGPTAEGEDHTYEAHITPFVTELAAQPTTADQ